jgi:hypothetical protein
MISFTAPLQGMTQAEDQFNVAAGRIAQSVSDPGSPATGDAIDLSAEMVALMQSRNDFAANVQVAHVTDQMTRATIDLFA